MPLKNFHFDLLPLFEVLSFSFLYFCFIFFILRQHCWWVFSMPCSPSKSLQHPHIHVRLPVSPANWFELTLPVDAYNYPSFIVRPICTTLPIRHFCCCSDFSRQMSNIWSGPLSSERLHIQIWYRTKFYRTLVLAHEQVRLTKFLVPKGTIYITKFGLDRGPIRIWSGPNWFCKQDHCWFLFVLFQ